MPESSFFSELRKRKVVQTAAIYGAVAWGVTEVIVTVVEQLFLPQWVSTLAVIGFVVGFPVAMFLAWTFDLTSEGLRRTAVTSRRGKASIFFSLLLLISGTAGLFLLIKPAIRENAAEAVSAPITAPPNSIAVLPFENASPDQDDLYLSEGLSDELRDQLSRIPELRVSARSSSVVVRQKSLDAPSMAASLGVRRLVEGNLRRQGNKLRVSVSLIEGGSGLTLWSETWERGPKELLTVQQAIAEQIVQIMLPESESLVMEPATRNVDANDLMLLARHYELQVRERQVTDVDLLLKAIDLYRQATEADPESAVAYSRLAGVLLYLGDLDAAEAPVFKALSLNPTLSEVQNTLGEFYWARGLPQAGDAFARAVELNPNNVDALSNRAFFLWLSYDTPVNEVDGIETYFRRAVELDPQSLSRHAALGEYLGKDTRVDEVKAVIENIEDLFDDAESCHLISWLNELIGQTDLAIGWAIRARDLEPDNPDHVGWLAELYAVIGDFETALRLEPEPGVGLLFRMRRYQELIDIGEFLMIEEPEDVDLRYLLAFGYTVTGQSEAAIHILGTTGLPDSVMNGVPRSVADIEGLFTLANALAAAGTAETAALARSMAQWNEDSGWWGDIGWIGLFRSCTLSILGRDEEALNELTHVKKSPRLRRIPLLRDSFCFQKYADNPVYRDVVRDQEKRRAALRERLPVTLAEFGVEL
jgi:TolB-like protein/tetratricopeptide (TPR) repeat protein